jgi:hypothetical protein
MNAKQQVLSLIQKLPDTSSFEDIQYHLYVLQKVQHGIEDAHLKGAVSQEQAESRLKEWLTE